jgi:hypothetical protein
VISVLGGKSEVPVTFHSSHKEVFLRLPGAHRKIRSLHPYSGPNVDRVNSFHPSVLTPHFGNDLIVHVTAFVVKLHAWFCECLTRQMTNGSKAVLIEIDLMTGKTFLLFVGYFLFMNQHMPRLTVRLWDSSKVGNVYN